MAKQIIEVEADIPEGWRAVAFREPVEGEHYLNYGSVWRCGSTYDMRDAMLLIVESVAVWREPTLKDLENGGIPCRMWDTGYEKSKVRTRLVAITAGDDRYFIAWDGVWYEHCEIEGTSLPPA